MALKARTAGWRRDMRFIKLLQLLLLWTTCAVASIEPLTEGKAPLIRHNMQLCFKLLYSGASSPGTCNQPAAESEPFSATKSLPCLPCMLLQALWSIHKAI
jgi:hypothetical protein